MTSSNLLIIVGIGFLTSASWAAETLPPPDMEMLEYLGTFETSGGKAVDPMDLRNSPHSGSSRKQPSTGYSGKERKKTEKAGMRKNPVVSPDTQSADPEDLGAAP
jgi:hypothetical protein